MMSGIKNFLFNKNLIQNILYTFWSLGFAIFVMMKYYIGYSELGATIFYVIVFLSLSIVNSISIQNLLILIFIKGTLFLIIFTSINLLLGIHDFRKNLFLDPYIRKYKLLTGKHV